MKIFARILLGIFLAIAVGFSFLLLWVVRDLEPQYRKVTEEPLADAAYTLAALASATARDGAIDTALFEKTFRETRRPFSARIYDFVKRDVDLHVYITDDKGVVVFDSQDEKAVGSDYSRWNDVYKALRGKYGSRTSRLLADDPASTVMYVAAPVVSGDRTIGILSVAALASATARDGAIDTALFEKTFRETRRPFSARIYDFVKRDVDLHVYITDDKGVVVFDSQDEKAVGSDYSRWNDVYKALRGKYGSRTSRLLADDPASTVMYVAAPVVSGDRTIGILSVGKPTRQSDRFVSASKQRILIGGAGVFLAVLMSTAVVSGMVTRPIKRLTEHALAVKEGKRASLPDLGTSEIRQLGAAFDEMRDALEGKQYVEHYVQTLTHEIKSPLSAIQGAAELVEEETMEPRERARFLENIRTEAQRIRLLVDKLLLLSSLESRKTSAETEPLDMNGIIADVLLAMSPQFEKKKVVLHQSSAEDCTFRGEEFLVRHAIQNILQNAVEFTPAGGAITVRSEACDGGIVVTVEDSGPGIPAYGLDKVFDRFYSLKRPDTGRKSSGLGLSLVLQVMNLHNGAVRIENKPAGGAAAILFFPKSPVL